MFKVVFSFILTLLFSLNTAPLLAQDWPAAPIINDEGGPVVITGTLTYTNPFFGDGISQPVIILEDQAGFVDRDRYFIFPPESQALGQLTSDFRRSPVGYSLALPIMPQGSLRDVARGNQPGSGVMIFAVAYWANIWGDPFLEVRDQQGGGWSTAYASTRVSNDPAREREVIGGKLLVYAPDDQQGFPSDFGVDGSLFTPDDPIVRLPQGYTVVDLDTSPFTFDRARAQVIDLIEPSGIALVDYSGLSFTEAFDAMIDKMAREYAFTEYKGIEWDMLHRKYRPFFEEADSTRNNQLYALALGEMLWSIPDGHINLRPLDLLLDQFRERALNGLGIAIRETDDGRAFVVFVAPDSQAVRAGLQPGTEILAVNDRPIAEQISRTQPWGQTFSTPHNRRLAQAQYALRFPNNISAVTLTFRNPNSDQTETVRLSPYPELESLFFEPESVNSPFDTPVVYSLLDSGYVYARIPSFNDDRALTIQLWERMIRALKSQPNRGLILDMRYNGGGSGFLADQMTAYFFNEPLIVGNRGSFNEETGEFYFDARGQQRLYLPEESLRYNGRIAVLVGPRCASACERFAYNMTLQDRAVVVGHYPTAGLGGSVNDFRMPLNITVRFTTGRSVDVDGNIHIEGLGIAPTLRVPVTQESLLSGEDAVLQAAIRYLDSQR